MNLHFMLSKKEKGIILSSYSIRFIPQYLLQPESILRGNESWFELLLKFECIRIAKI